MRSLRSPFIFLILLLEHGSRSVVDVTWSDVEFISNKHDNRRHFSISHPHKASM